MLFKKKEDIDIDELKRLVKDSSEQKKLPVAIQRPQQAAPKSDTATPARQVPKSYESESAPLFIKLSKYNEVLSNLQELKAFIAGLKQVFQILSEIEILRSEALKLMRASVQRIERNIVELDTGLLRPPGSPEMPHSNKEIHSVEGSLSDLQKQLRSLRSELERFK
ncbi:MAG: hypothetical protein J7J92_02565 [Candidatus Aenigmarchaeota archaeon]|nr:hypothetical protein [Candidatus Aenigmarchaeota archaeon]